MHVILAAITDSPYRQAVESFAEQFADLLDGRVKLATLGQRTRSDTQTEAPASEDEEEGLLERREAGAVEDFRQADRGPETPVEGEWLGGDPVDEVVRTLAHCDFGVVGKGLTGEPTGGAALGSEVSELKQQCTKPLVIVPKEVGPIRNVLFVYTEHPEAGHALYLAKPLAEKGCSIHLTSALSPFGERRLVGGGAGYLTEHDVAFEEVELECEDAAATAGPAGQILQTAREQSIDLIVMGGTRRGFLGQLLWPEMAREVAWNAQVPVLIWY